MVRIAIGISLLLVTGSAEATPASDSALNECVKGAALQMAKTSSESADTIVKAAFSKCGRELQDARDTASIETAITDLNSRVSGARYDKQSATADMVDQWRQAAADQAVAAVIEARSKSSKKTHRK